MNIEQINEKLKTREYDFLKENENLNNNIIKIYNKEIISYINYL